MSVDASGTRTVKPNLMNPFKLTQERKQVAFASTKTTITTDRKLALLMIWIFLKGKRQISNISTTQKDRKIIFFARWSRIQAGCELNHWSMFLKRGIYTLRALSSKESNALPYTLRPSGKRFLSATYYKMTSIASIPAKQAVIYYDHTGGPEVLKYSTEFPTPGKLLPTEILVKNKYSGINFIEVYFRNGIYPAKFPYIPGREASGEVVATGDEVSNFEIGDKISYLGNENFAQFTKLDAKKVSIVNLGKDATDDQLKLYTASLLQGLTALTLVDEAYQVKEGDYVLVTAAAGGVGLLLDQLIGKIKKAHVIAVASSEAKLEKARKNGAEFLLNSSTLSYDEISEKILELTNNNGVDVIYDSIGKDTFEMDMKVIKRKGSLVSFGNASGAVPPLSINRLSAKNIKLLRPQLFGYIAEPEEFQHYTKALFDLIDSGKLNIEIHHVYPLKDYPTATSEMEGRRTTGKLLLEIPN